MFTIRQGTFETNSSSCHSLTVMTKGIWDSFKKREVFIRCSHFSAIEIHTTVFDEINNENKDDYLVNAEDYYKEVVKEAKAYFGSTLSNRYVYSSSEFNNAVDNFIKKNLTVEMVKDALLGKKDKKVLYTFNKPIVEDYSHYHYDGLEHKIVYKNITVRDIYQRIFDNGDFDVPHVYIYGLYTWKKEDIKIWTPRGAKKGIESETKVLLDREIWD